MARLPQPGSDKGQWGVILNDYLSQTHKPDGSLKDDIITAVQIQNGTITEAQLDTDVITKLNATAGTPDWTDITNKPTVIAAGTDATAARAAIGAGTSNLTLGTTGSTAKAGDYQPSWSDVTSKPSTFAPSAHTHIATDISNSTTTGRSLITAADPAAARAAIGIVTDYIDITAAPYSAIADSTTDNTAAIQAALDTANGRPVYVPPGVFGIASPLIMNPGQVLIGANSGGSAWLSGTGPDVSALSTLKALAGLSGPMISGPAASGYVQLRDLHLDGNSVAANGIYLEPYSPSVEAQWLMQRLFVHGATSDGIYIGQGRRAVRGWRVVSCYNGGNGVMQFGSDSAWHDGLFGTNGENGFYAAGTQTRIFSGDIFGNTASGVRVWNGTNEVTIAHNSCDRNGLHGIHIGDNSFGITILDNLLTKNSAAGDNGGAGAAADIYIQASTWISIVGNKFLADEAPKVAHNVMLTANMPLIELYEYGNMYMEADADLADLMGLPGPVSGTLFGRFNANAANAFALADTEKKAIDNHAPRVYTVTAPGAVPTIDFTQYDQFNLLGLNANISYLATTGNLVDGREFVIALRDNGTVRTINFGTDFRLVGPTFSGSTTAGKLTYVTCRANGADSKIDVIDIRTQA